MKHREKGKKKAKPAVPADADVTGIQYRNRIPIKCGKCGKLFAINYRAGRADARQLEVLEEGLMVKAVDIKKNVFAVVCPPPCGYETITSLPAIFQVPVITGASVARIKATEKRDDKKS